MNASTLAIGMPGPFELILIAAFALVPVIVIATIAVVIARRDKRKTDRPGPR